jgi:small GTP-binding protein
MSSVDLKIVVLGSAFVGKTSIINRYCNGSFSEDTLSTIGAGFFTNTMTIDGTEITSMLWDTAGEERFRSVAPSLLRGANGLVLVYDVTSPNSFNDINIYMEMFLDTCKFDPTIALPVLLLGNKSDLEAIVPMEQVDEWKLKNHVAYSALVSAKTGDNIKKSMDEFIKTLVNPEMSMDTQPIKIVITADEKKSGCC